MNLKILLIITLLMSLFRLYLASNIELLPDEAYYYRWSKKLATGYLDHPPMVAWLIKSTSFVDRELGIRLFPLFSGALMPIIIFIIARPYMDENNATIAAIMGQMLFPLAIYGLFATPDSPMLLFWAVGLLAFQKALFCKKKLGWWMLSGFLAGLGLLSKYTMILFVLACFFALLHKKHRHLLASPGPWLALFMAFIAFSPVIFWNWENEFISFKFQFDHGLIPESFTPLKNLTEYGLTQLFMATPTGLILMLISKNCVDFERISWLLPFFLTPLVFFGFSSLFSRVEANWPAPAWIAGSILLASIAKKYKGLTKTSLYTASIITIILFIHCLTFFIPFPFGRDPAAKVYGWKKLASVLEKRAQNSIIITRNHQMAGALDYYLPSHKTLSLDRIGKMAQSSVSNIPPKSYNGMALIVNLAHQDNLEKYAHLFEKISQPDIISIFAGERKLVKYHIRVAKGLKPFENMDTSK